MNHHLADFDPYTEGLADEMAEHLAESWVDPAEALDEMAAFFGF